MRFVISRLADGRYRWTLHGHGGDVLATSEPCWEPATCRASVEAVQRNAADAAVVDETAAAPGSGPA